MRKFAIILLIILSLSLLSCEGNNSADNNIKDPNNNIENVDPEEYDQSRDMLIPNKVEKVEYKGRIEHIFFHPLITYPELAFDGDYKSRGLDDYFVTVKEFKRILDSLYENNFILVDINSLYEETVVNGKKTMKRAKLMVPKDKKPIIISVDDLNYYGYMIENGNVYKLILDEKGEIATYSKNPKGEEIISHDNEIVPIIDAFVRKHPDFSLNGAKGTIALTGFEGILGYRTQNDSPIRESEINVVLPIINRLKETGWNFAVHGYGHYNTPKVSYEKIVVDTKMWKDEIESLVGKTQVYIYPYGARVLPGDKKFDYLVNSGYKILCAVGNSSYEKVTQKAVMTDRRHIDGIAFRYQPEDLKDLFDVKVIFDKEARPLYGSRDNVSK